MRSLLPLTISTVVLILAAGCDSPDHSGLSRHRCRDQLKSIEGAMRTWMLEKRKTTNDVPADSDLFGATLYVREKPECPNGGTYTIGKVGEKPRCSIKGHTI